MPIRITMAIRMATKFRAAMRRMLAYSISQKSNLPAAIDRGAAASAQVENPRLYLPIASANIFPNCRERARQASVGDGCEASALQLTRLRKDQI
jgi:hypothetical protein